MPGSGSLSFTGQIGDVMRESGHAAYSLIRSRAQKLRIQQEVFARSDVHVHIPAGAVPKDGPSAGLALVTALISALKDKPIDPLTAMTGEITLRGAVLPVGGIKEKVLAAHRAGIRRVFLPAHNMKDLDEVPPEVRDEITFVPVKTVDDVVPGVFQPAPKKRAARRTPVAGTRAVRPKPKGAPSRAAKRPAARPAARPARRKAPAKKRKSSARRSAGGSA